jgi:Uma2 family endonuclease
MAMPTLTIDQLEIPFDIQTLEGFRAWVRTLEEGAPRVSFIQGDVWLEMTPQNYRSHSPIVREINWTLIGLTKVLKSGVYFTPPSWLTSTEAGLSTEPDGFFATFETLKSGVMRLNPERADEMQGRPDFVFEAVSTSSRRKDQVQLVKAYAQAGITEYWIADLREDRADLRVLILGAGKYRQVPADADGFCASPTWGRSFRLRRYVNEAGMPDVEVEVRTPT